MAFPFRGKHPNRFCDRRMQTAFPCWEAEQGWRARLPPAPRSPSPRAAGTVLPAFLQRRFVWSWKVLSEDGDKTTPKLDHACFPICEGSTGAVCSLVGVSCKSLRPARRPAQAGGLRQMRKSLKKNPQGSEERRGKASLPLVFNAAVRQFNECSLRMLR